MTNTIPESQAPAGEHVRRERHEHDGHPDGRCLTLPALNRRWAVAEDVPAGDRPVAGVNSEAPPAAGTHAFRTMMSLIGDGVLLMLAVYLFPLIILLVGAPVALGLRALIELVRRFL